MEVDDEGEAITGLSGDERARFGTGHASRPASARLDPRSSIGGPQLEVDFVRRLAFERGVRPMFIIPREEHCELPAEAHLALRHHNPASRLVFHGPDESLDNSDAPMLPDGAESRANSLASAPALEAIAPEDGVLVADQVLGRRVMPSDDLSKESTHRD